DVYFYSHKGENKDCFKISKNDSSFLVSDVYQECITMVFVKDKKDKEIKEKLKIFMDSIHI
ncbi:MAG: hypothetical protein Barrevirus43_1, partial [Barrevirus sp.]